MSTINRFNDLSDLGVLKLHFCLTTVMSLPNANYRGPIVIFQNEYCTACGRPWSWSKGMFSMMLNRSIAKQNPWKVLLKNNTDNLVLRSNCVSHMLTMKIESGLIDPKAFFKSIRVNNICLSCLSERSWNIVHSTFLDHRVLKVEWCREMMSNLLPYNGEEDCWMHFMNWSTQSVLLVPEKELSYILGS